MATIQKYTFGRGELYFARFKPGTHTPDGFRYIGNTPAFGFTIQSQTLDHYNSDHGVGELDLQIPTTVTRTGAFTTDNISIENLALTVFGAAAKVVSTASTAVTETVTAAHLDYKYQLGITPGNPAGRRAISNVAVKVGNVAKTAGTDFLVDTQRGLLQPISGGTITDSSDLAVTYDQIANSYDQVVSGNTPVEGTIMFVADNVQGDNLDYLLPYVKITPNGEFALKAENALQQLQYNLSVLKDAGKAAYYVNGQAVTTA